MAGHLLRVIKDLLYTEKGNVKLFNLTFYSRCMDIHMKKLEAIKNKNTCHKYETAAKMIE